MGILSVSLSTVQKMWDALLGIDGRALTHRELEAKYLFDCSHSVPAHRQHGLRGNWEPVSAADGSHVWQVKLNRGTLFSQPRWAGPKREMPAYSCKCISV